MKMTGFPWLMRGMAACHFLYAPLILKLRNEAQINSNLVSSFGICKCPA